MKMKHFVGNTKAPAKRTNPIRRQVSVAALTLAAALLAFPPASRGDILYVSLYEVNQIEKYDLATGADLGVFADANAGLAYPIGLATDSGGNLYVANGNHTILKFTPGGVGSVFASIAPLNPVGLTIDNAGNVYTSDPGKNIIEKFSPAGTDLGVFASADNSLNWPYALASDSAGNIYVANCWNRNNGLSYMRFTPAGVGTGVASDSGMAYAVAVNSQGTLYGADNYGTIFGGAVDVNLYPETAWGLVCDSSDNLYAAVESSSTDNRIEKFTPDGTGSVFALTGGGQDQPWGIAIAVPEPSTSVLLGLATALMIARRRR